MLTPQRFFDRLLLQPTIPRRGLTACCRRIGFVLVVLSVVVGQTTNAAAADAPLNLLIIQTDEHNFRTLGCYRDLLPSEQAFIWGPGAVVETPHIDSIAARGAVCTSYYASSPVCTPSRAAFFSGKYSHNTGSPANNKPLNNDVITFAEVLRRAGYATGYAGKWHLDGPGKPQWQPERQFGFADNRFMFNRGHWKQFEIVDGKPEVKAKNDNGQPTYSVAGADAESFSTDWLTDRAIEFIEQHRGEPFCYHLSLPDPHGPNTVREPYDTMYDNLPIRPPLTFEKGVQQRPAWLGGNPQKNVRFNAPAMADYFGMVRCIDDNVGRLLQRLQDLGIRERTAIVITADHGDLCFEHGRLNKGNPYEGSARIPMVVEVPGRIAAGTVVEPALGTVDFAPTMLSLLQADPLPVAEGRDASSLFTDQLADTTEAWTDVTFLRNAGTSASWLAAVSDRYKLIVSVQDQPWLYDLQEDPDELINRFEDPALQEVQAELAAALLEYGKRFDDPFTQHPKIATDLQNILD